MIKFSVCSITTKYKKKHALKISTIYIKSNIISSIKVIEYYFTTFIYLKIVYFSGAFLVTYFIMLFLMGMPIFLLELVIGQYSGLGPDQAFTRMAPIFSGLGYCTLVVITLVTIYYMVVIAWSLFYLFASFTSTLGYGRCDNDFNTIGKQKEK